MKKAALPIIIIAIIFLALWLAYTANKTSQNKQASVNQKSYGKESQSAKIEYVAPKNDNKKEVLKVYFINGSLLKAEVRKGRFQPKEALEILMQGPKVKGNASFIPAKTRILSFKTIGSRAIVNFSKEILQPENVGAEAEELTIYSIVNTLTEFPSIKDVFFQVEGKSEGEVDGFFVEDFWGHIGLYDQPFKRNEALIKY